MNRCLFLVGLIIAAVQAQLLSNEDLAKIRKIHDDCVKETGVDASVDTKAIKGEYSDDPKLKMQILCVNKKAGFMDESGNIMEDVITAKLVENFHNANIVTASVKQCAQKKADPMETAFEMTKCLHSLAPADIDFKGLF